MKTKEELNAIKNEVETVSRKLAQLNEEELSQVSGGVGPRGFSYLPVCDPPVIVAPGHCPCDDSWVLE